MPPFVAPRPSTPPQLRKHLADKALFEMYAAGDVRAREEIARRHMPLARRLTGRYRSSSEHRDDLEQVAFVGLIKAIDRYEPDIGPFTAFAIHTIRGELKRHFRDRGWTMRVARPAQEHALKVSAAVEKLTGRLHRSPRIQELVAETGLSGEDVLEGLLAAQAYSPLSTDAPLAGEGEERRTLGDTVGGHDRGYDAVEAKVMVDPLVGALPEREREIVRMRFEQELRQSEIADHIGISQMHVSRLLRRSLHSMYEMLEKTAA